MKTAHRSYRLPVMLLTVLAVLSSAPVCGFANGPVQDVPDGRPPFDRDERSPRSLAYTLEDPFKTALSMPTTTAALVSGLTSTTAEQGQSDTGKAAVPPFGTYVKEFVPDVVGGTKRIFYKENLPVALIGVGLTGLALTVDHRVEEYFQDRKPLEHVEKIGDKLGNGITEVGVSLALLGTGELIDDKKMADTGAVSLQAYVIDGVFTETLKLTVKRERPNHGNHNSFPSGHASITATMAGSISEMYDWDLRIAVPLYLTTAFVGATRLQANEHFLSDVIAGMTLGTLVGMSVAKYHKEKGSQGALQNISITPVYDKDLRGCLLTLRFL